MRELAASTAQKRAREGARKSKIEVDIEKEKARSGSSPILRSRNSLIVLARSFLNSGFDIEIFSWIIARSPVFDCKLLTRNDTPALPSPFLQLSLVLPCCSPSIRAFIYIFYIDSSFKSFNKSVFYPAFSSFILHNEICACNCFFLIAQSLLNVRPFFIDDKNEPVQ